MPTAKGPDLCSAARIAGLLAGATLIELPGLAHVPHLQDTPRFCAAIAEFVGQHG